jgi:hypothetical protein
MASGISHTTIHQFKRDFTMLSNEHEAKASQPEVAEVGQEELRKVIGGFDTPDNAVLTRLAIKMKISQMNDKL